MMPGVKGHVTLIDLKNREKITSVLMGGFLGGIDTNLSDGLNFSNKALEHMILRHSVQNLQEYMV